MIEHIEQGTLPPGKKAVISLTSWKKRIADTGLTIFSLYTTCGTDFHIVLTLAEEEFPGKENDLPHDLIILKRAGIVEILWVKKNYKTFKKILFAQVRYPTVPVISADDGCVYIYDYASILYVLWETTGKQYIMSNKFWGKSKYPGGGGGHGILYPPYCFKDVGIKVLDKHFKSMLYNPNDDRFIACLSGIMKLKWKYTRDYNLERTPFINLYEGGTQYIKGDDWKFPEFIKDAVSKM